MFDAYSKIDVLHEDVPAGADFGVALPVARPVVLPAFHAYLLSLPLLLYV